MASQFRFLTTEAELVSATQIHIIRISNSEDFNSPNVFHEETLYIEMVDKQQKTL